MMKDDGVEMRTRVLLTMQSALLGMVTADMRSALVSWSDRNVRLRLLFEGPLSPDHAELASEIETEVISHLPEHSVECVAELCPPSGRSNPRSNESLVFQRASDR